MIPKPDTDIALWLCVYQIPVTLAVQLRSFVNMYVARQ